MKKSSPKLSVCVVTFNQERYIAQCLQSLVDQLVDFEYEIVVGDDCSTDGTSKIVSEFSERYPKLVRAFTHSKNIGAYGNYLFTHRAARGDYVAHIDGDDYALPNKLARQVATLDLDSTIALSVHAVDVEGERRRIGDAEHLPVVGHMDDLLRIGPYFVNSSIMYRKINSHIYLNEEEKVDYQVYLEHAGRGGIHLAKESLGVYRWHAGGISKNTEYREKIENLYMGAFQRALELGAPEQLVKSALLTRKRSMAIARLLDGDLRGFRRMISISAGDRKYASAKHRILDAFKNVPIGSFGLRVARSLVK